MFKTARAAPIEARPSEVCLVARLDASETRRKPTGHQAQPGELEIARLATRPIESIIVGERIRQDMGDLKELALAAAEAEPERFGKLQADMDRTGRVHGPFLEIARLATRPIESIIVGERIRQDMGDLKELALAAAEAEPERFGKLQADMDRTGRVHGPFRRLTVIQQGDAIRRSPPPLPGKGPYCELFARVERPGWDCHGDEVAT
jgi:hypothetical protein